MRPEFIRDLAAQYGCDHDRYHELAEHRDQVFQEYLQDKSKRNLDRVVVAHIPLIVSIVRRISRDRQIFSDLLQEGVIALLRAVQTFHGGSFVTHGFSNVYWRLHRYIRTHHNNFLYRGAAAIPTLQSSVQGKVESIDSTEPLKVWLGGLDEFSPILPHRADIATEALVMMPSVEDDLDRYRRDAEVREAIDKFAQHLTPRQRDVLYNRILNQDDCTMEQLAQRLGISRQRVCQIETDLLRRLARVLEEFRHVNLDT